MICRRREKRKGDADRKLIYVVGGSQEVKNTYAHAKSMQGSGLKALVAEASRLRWLFELARI
jgi:hypothetical protein